jgi:hypothetical protein
VCQLQHRKVRKIAGYYVVTSIQKERKKERKIDRVYCKKNSCLFFLFVLLLLLFTVLGVVVVVSFVVS